MTLSVCVFRINLPIANLGDIKKHIYEQYKLRIPTKTSLTSVFGGEIQNCINPILAFSILLGPLIPADF